MDARRRKRSCDVEEGEFDDQLAEIEKRYLSPLKVCDDWPDVESSSDDSSDTSSGSSLESEETASDNDNSQDDTSIFESVENSGDITEHHGNYHQREDTLESRWDASKPQTPDPDPPWADFAGPSWAYGPSQTWRTNVVDSDFFPPVNDRNITYLSSVEPHISEGTPGYHEFSESAPTTPPLRRMSVAQSRLFHTSEPKEPLIQTSALTTPPPKRKSVAKSRLFHTSEPDEPVISTSAPTTPPRRKSVARGRRLPTSVSAEPTIPPPVANKPRGRPRGRPKSTRTPPATTSTRKRAKKTKKKRGKPLKKSVRDLLDKKWEWLNLKPLDLFMQQFDFTGPQPGPTQAYNRPIDPLEVFESFQTDEIVDFIVHESNIFGRKKRFASQGRDRLEAWQDIKSDEIRILDAILITMGIVNMPHLDHYWSTDPLFDYGFIRKIITRDHFLRIFRSLHFSDVEVEESNGDKLYKMRKLIDMYKFIFRYNYNPGRNISVDEAVTLYKSDRVPFKVSQPRKKAKTGIQQYRICEAETGYCLDFEVYSASNVEPYESVTIEGHDISDFTIPAKIALHLIKPYLNKGHTLGIDSFCSDPRLFELLE